MITLERDAVKFLHMIDMRKIKNPGVETYDANSFSYRMSRCLCCCYKWDYELKYISNPFFKVIFQKKSLNKFLSENLDKPINVDDYTQQKVVRLIYKVAKKFVESGKDQPKISYNPVAFQMGLKKEIFPSTDETFEIQTANNLFVPVPEQKDPLS